MHWHPFPDSSDLPQLPVLLFLSAHLPAFLQTLLILPFLHRYQLLLSALHLLLFLFAEFLPSSALFPVFDNANVKDTGRVMYRKIRADAAILP